MAWPCQLGVPLPFQLLLIEFASPPNERQMPDADEGNPGDPDQAPIAPSSSRIIPARAITTCMAGLRESTCLGQVRCGVPGAAGPTTVAINARKAAASNERSVLMFRSLHPSPTVDNDPSYGRRRALRPSPSSARSVVSPSARSPILGVVGPKYISTMKVVLAEDRIIIRLCAWLRPWPERSRPRPQDQRRQLRLRR